MLMDMQTYLMLGILIVVVVLFIVWGVFQSKKRKKQEQEARDLINAVKPGNKVKTIGGICGIVVEVNDEDDTFVLETGSENSGKSFIKFDRQAIYQTDAVVEKAAPETPAEEANAEGEEQPAEADPSTEATAEASAEQPAEAVAVEEANAEEATATIGGDDGATKSGKHKKHKK